MSCSVPMKTVSLQLAIQYKGFLFKPQSKYIDVLAEAIIGLNVNDEETGASFTGEVWLTYVDGKAPVTTGAPCRKKYSCKAICHTPCCGDQTQQVFNKNVRGNISSTLLSLFSSSESDDLLWRNGHCMPDPSKLEDVKKECEKRAKSICTGSHSLDISVPAW